MAARLPELWGVLNVTPDSFSDGGLFVTPDRAIERGRELVNHGAAVVDVGAESTRPGAERIDATTEIDRLTPVVRELVESQITVSVDTMRAEVAWQMIELGAEVINDVSGGQADSEMAAVIASSAVRYVLMHWRGHSDQMDALANYDDVTAEVSRELRGQIDQVVAQGVDPGRIIVDPGLGFAKNVEHNWELVTHLDQIVDIGHPVLMGASRKRFLGALLDRPHEPADRDGVSAVLSVVAAQKGVSMIRVHEPRVHFDALRVWQRSLPEGGVDE